MELEGNEEHVYIGDKNIKVYIPACLFAFGKSDKVVISSRGSNIKKAIDVAAIIMREHLINPDYDVIIESHGFEERNVSSLDIIISGELKNGESESIQE